MSTTQRSTQSVRDAFAQEQRESRTMKYNEYRKLLTRVANGKAGRDELGSFIALATELGFDATESQRHVDVLRDLSLHEERAKTLPRCRQDLADAERKVAERSAALAEALKEFGGPLEEALGEQSLCQRAVFVASEAVRYCEGLADRYPNLFAADRERIREFAYEPDAETPDAETPDAAKPSKGASVKSAPAKGAPAKGA